MDRRPVTVLILCWNRWDLTKRCLESLRRHTDLSRVEVLVVDNGSSDETPRRLAEYDWVRTVRNEANLGFVRGNNAGLRTIEAGNDVLLLNNDVEIRQSNWIEELQRTAYSAPDVGVVGCRLILPDGRLLHAGTRIEPDTLWGQQIGSGEVDGNQFSADREVQGVVFACAYIRRETLDAIGGLSEAYESYFEDTDYCLRAADHGLRTLCCGAVTLVHAEHGSTEGKEAIFEALFERSRREFRRQWSEKLEARYRYGVAWTSDLGGHGGHAVASRQLLPKLDERGIRLSHARLPPGAEPGNTGDHFLNVICNRKASKDTLISVICSPAERFPAAEGRYRIGYTMTNVDGVPPAWVSCANEMDEIWTPWQANVDVLRRAGVESLIVRMPIGVDTDRFHPKAHGHGSPDGDFVFLAAGSAVELDATCDLLVAFNRAFRSEDPVALVCVFSRRDMAARARSVIESLGLRARGGRIALLDDRGFSDAERPCLFRSADCFVSIAEGEDPGRALLEAMACGLPVVAMDWGASADILSPQTGYRLESLGTTRVRSPLPHQHGFSRAMPDADHLARLLGEIASDPGSCRDRGRRAAEVVEERWSLRAAVQRVESRLDNIQSELGSARRTSAARGTAAEADSIEVPTVAIDMSRALGAQISGIGRYAANLALGLSRHATRDQRFLLLPGFACYVHPAYGSTFYLDAPPGSHMAAYRGPIPTYSRKHEEPGGVSLVHATANVMPEVASSPVVMTVYDLSFETHPEYHTSENIDLCSKNLEQAIRQEATFIAISENTRQDLLRRHRIAEERIRVVPCTFDGRVFHPRSKEAIAPVLARYGIEGPYLLFLGTLEPRKNLETVLSAVEKYDVGVPLVVAGARGWLDDKIHKRLRQARRLVRAIGFVADADLPFLYSGARGLVYPSHYEGFGLPLLEALACGTPVVATRISAMPEVVGEAGFLLDEATDAEALAEAMGRLAGDGPDRAAYADKATRQAARFDLGSTTHALQAVYRDVLCAADPGRRGRAAAGPAC